MFVNTSDIYQRSKIKSFNNRSFYPRILFDYPTVESLSFDIKYIPQVLMDLNICEITNFVLAVYIKTRVAQVVAEASIHKVICIFGLPI